MTELFTIGPTTKLGSMGSRKTVECMTPPSFSVLDEHFYQNLPEYQQAIGPCSVTSVTLGTKLSIAEWAAAILGIARDTISWQVGMMLRLKSLTMTLPQVEKMVALTITGAHTGMCINKPGNFCFVDHKYIGAIPVYLSGGCTWDKCALTIADSRLWFKGFSLLLPNWAPN